MNHTVMTLGGIRLEYQLKFPETANCFGWHMTSSESGTSFSISLSDELFLERRIEFSERASNSFVEYRTLVEPTGKELAEHDVFIFHAVAFAWKEHAWLLAAPSGTGKTTQYRNWERLWPDDVSMICGDMPILRSGSNGKITVFPSPWNGKERIGQNNHSSFPLGGTVFLSQSDHNHMVTGNLKDLVLPIWRQFIGQPDTAVQAAATARFEECLLEEYPVWRFENRGDEESTKIMRETFDNYLNHHKRAAQHQECI